MATEIDKLQRFSRTQFNMVPDQSGGWLLADDVLAAVAAIEERHASAVAGLESSYQVQIRELKHDAELAGIMIKSRDETISGMEERHRREVVELRHDLDRKSRDLGNALTECESLRKWAGEPKP